jgi:hypothetical protein
MQSGFIAESHAVSGGPEKVDGKVATPFSNHQCRIEASKVSFERASINVVVWANECPVNPLTARIPPPTNDNEEACWASCSFPDDWFATS